MQKANGFLTILTDQQSIMKEYGQTFSQSRSTYYICFWKAHNNNYVITVYLQDL